MLEQRTIRIPARLDRTAALARLNALVGRCHNRPPLDRRIFGGLPVTGASGRRLPGTGNRQFHRMTDLHLWQYAAIALLFVWSGFVRSGLGFGGAALTLPLLLLVVDNPVVFLPIIAVHLLVFGFFTVGTRFDHVDYRFLLRSMPII